MFAYHLKIAWRNLLKDKQFTFLNVTGLATGLACALLIFLWVSDELSFDKSFDGTEYIYQLGEQKSGDANTGLGIESSGLLSEAVARQSPEVQYAAPVAPPGWFPLYTLSVNDKNIKAACQYTGKNYFNIFSFPLLSGNKNTVLAANNSMVISDELAVKLFGTTDNLLGKPIRFQHDTTFYVSGVFKKMNSHSSQQFDCVMSFDYFKNHSAMGNQLE